MDQATQLLILIAAALVGITAALVMLRRQRREREDAARENPYATSSEGQKRCPSCGAYNAWTDRNCVSCGRKLPG
jgi:ABC-type nickel/cobalt efflux system permease component RcnA